MKCYKYNSFSLFKLTFEVHFRFDFISVSDFNESLSQLYEEHATALQSLVSNYRKKNAELRKERYVLRCHGYQIQWSFFNDMFILFSFPLPITISLPFWAFVKCWQTRLPSGHLSGMGNIPAGSGNRLAGLQRCCQRPQPPGEKAFKNCMWENCRQLNGLLVLTSMATKTKTKTKPL